MADSQSPSPLEAHLGYWLRAVSNAVSQEFARKLEGQGVTVAEWVYLRTLYDAPDVSPSVLAERMGMTKGAISKLGERLVIKNLVRRRADSDDGRGHKLALKPRAEVLVRSLAKIADDNDANFFACLTRSERESLRATLQKMATALNLNRAPID